MYQRLTQLTAWTALAFVTVFLALSAFYARTIEWNAMRLAVTAAVAAGEPIYPAPDAGVITGHIYPPVAAWVFLPALLLPTLGSQVAAGAVISMLFVLGPLAALVWLAVRLGGVDRATAMLLFAISVLVCLLDPGLRYVTVMVHADGPAIALGGVALLCAAFATSAADHRWLAAGACIAAACGCKQTLLPTAVLVSVIAFARYSFRGLLRLAAGALAISLAVFGWLAITGQLGTFFYNTLELPRHHPWATTGYGFVWGQPATGQSHGERLRAVVDVFIPLVQRFWPLLSIGSVAILRLHCAVHPLARFAGFAGLATWLQFPLLLASAVKVGGDVNNQAPSPWFALAATVAILLSWLVAPTPAQSASAARTVLAAAAVVLALANVPRFGFLCGAVLRPASTNAAMAAYLRAHPGTVYLPWNPLLTYRIEGRRYHFEYGVFDRALANRPISSVHYRAHLPPKLAYVAVRTDQPPSAFEVYRQYLDLRLIDSPVPGWIFYAVAPTAQAP